jgi:energy-converting hydrogenase Eha subunit G
MVIDFGLITFVIGMLAYGYMANPFMSMMFAFMSIVFFVLSRKKTVYKKLRWVGIVVGIMSCFMSIWLSMYSNYLTTQQEQALSYDNYENYYSIDGADDTGTEYDVDTDAE